MKSLFHWVLILLFSLGLSGCSIIMALSGEEEPDFKSVMLGASRAEVEAQMGKPVHSESLGSEVKDTYVYEIGDPPDGRRALAHLFLNVYTFGLYEIVGTSAELFVHVGKDNQIDVIYGADGKVKELSEPIPVDLKEASASHE